MAKRIPTIGSVGVTIAAGSALGVLVTVALTPLISRIYSPELFGEFATLVATASVLIGFSTLRLEIFAQAEESNSDYVAAMRLALANSLVISFLSTLVSLVIVMTTGIAPIWLLIGPLVFVGSLQLTGAAALVRRRSYRNLSLANFWQQGTIGVWQVAIGVFSASIGALIIAFALARVIWLAPTALSLRPVAGNLRQYWNIRAKEAITAGFSALINSLAGQTLIIIVAFAYGSTEVGLLAMAVRIVVSPVGMAAQAFSSAVVGEVGNTIRSGELQAARSTVMRGLLANLKLGFVPVAGIAFVSPFLAGRILGSEWSEVGVVITALSVGALAQFVVSPFSQVLNLTSRSGLLLIWDAVRLSVYLVAVGIPALFGLNWLVAISLYSAGQVAVYALLVCVLRSSLAEKAPVGAN